MFKTKLTFGIALICFTLLMVSIPMPVSAANKTLSQRIKDIKAEYDVVVEIKVLDYYTDAPTNDQEDLTAKSLTEIEKALAYLGPNFTKKVTKSFADKLQGTRWENGKNVDDFRIVLTIWPYLPEEMLVAGMMSTTGEMTLYRTSSDAFKARTVVHEYGHALHSIYDYYESDLFDSPLYGIDSEETGLLSDFVSTYAYTNYKEDYAECFATAILNGGINKFKGNDVVWRKMNMVFKDLKNYAGAGSRATKRFEEYLQG